MRGSRTATTSAARTAPRRRRWLLAGAALVLAVGSVPQVRGADPGPPELTAIEQSLAGIDFLPDALTLERLMVDTAQLVGLATTGTEACENIVNDESDEGTENSVRIGVRIRAFRSLGLFDNPVARAGLTAAIESYRESDDPCTQLYLIAALEALGDIAGQDDVATLAASFSHDRRDVRAATARALGQTGLTAACAPLDLQLGPETDDQVRRAIGDALEQLGARCP